MVSFANLSLVRVRYPTIDDHGTSVPDYDAEPAETTLTGFWVEPIESQEDNDGRLAVLSGYSVVGPYDVDLKSTDRVSFAGEVYELAGDVMRVPSPTGALNASKFSLRRWKHGS